ncbi:MAG: nucleotide exchange factor GrpE [Leeuwenhoekiella sp.]
MSTSDKNTISEERRQADENKDSVQTEEQQAQTEDNQEQQTEESQDNEKQDDSLEKYKADLEKEKDKFLRLFAEFENYKRRTSKERMDLFKTAGQEVMQSLLPVLDDFDRALPEISKNEDKELTKGVELISNKLRETLKAKGLVEIEIKEGDAFDAELHEAITQIPAPKSSLKGKVVDVVEKGYQLGNKVIRFPKVVVGK